MNTNNLDNGNLSNTKRIFIYQDVNTHKFWEIELSGKKITVYFGKYGANPRTTVKSFESEEKALKEVKKLIRSKTGEGYMETTEGALPLPDISHLMVKREYPFSTKGMYIEGYSGSLDTMRERAKRDAESLLHYGFITEPIKPELIEEMANVIWQNFHDKMEIIRLANEQAVKNEEKNNPELKKAKEEAEAKAKANEPLNLPANGKITKKLLKEMYDAIQAKNVERVKALVEFGITGNHEHKYPLFIDAIVSENPEIIRLITPTLTTYFEKDEQFHHHHHRMLTSLLFSCSKEVIFAAIDAGYDLTKDPYLFEQIGAVKDMEVIDRILQIVPLEQDKGDAMISAVKESNVPLVDYLLERNARLDGMDYFNGQFVMHIALLHFYKDNLDVIRRLLAKGADMHAVSLGNLDWRDASKPRTGGGATPMSYFTEGVGRYGALTPEIKELFKAYEKEIHFTPEQVFKAARDAQFYILEKYLENGDANIRDENGATLLHHTMLQHQNTDTQKMVGMLVEHGIDVNAKDNNGRNALFYIDIRTCYSGKLTVVNYLKNQGIELDCLDNEGLSPIMFHCTQRPLFYSDSNDENNVGESEWTGRATALEFITRAGADLNLRYADGKTIFHYIPTLPSFYDDDEIVELMMAKGGNVNLLDEHGRSPLHYCISKKYSVGMDDRIAIYVKKGKAKLNVQDKDGNTPLHYLILNGEERSVSDLLRHGANPTISNNEGKTVEDLMKEKGILNDYKSLLAEFHKTPPQTRNIEHIWKPVEVVAEDKNEPVKDMKIYGSLVLKGHSTGDDLFTAGKNRIICSDLHKRLTCIDSLTGNILWEEREYAGHECAFYYPKDDLIYSGYDHSTVMATNPATGKTVWKVGIAFSYDTFSSDFLIYQDKLLLFHSKYSAYAVNKETKKIAWKIKFSGDLECHEAVIWKNYYIVQMNKANKAIFNLINMDSGELERTIETQQGFKDRYGEGLVIDNDLWYISDDGTMCCLDLETGNMKDSALTTEFIHNPKMLFIHGFYYVNEKFYFRISLIDHDGSEDGFYECDKNMNIKKILPYTEMFANSYQKGDTLYFISQRNHSVTALSLTDKTIRETELPLFSGMDIIESAPCVNNGTLFITQLGGNENEDKQILYAIK